ncbi:MAG TPA: hypothetical protein P5061_12525, partial [Mycobacterium sp.]|nr:hypothetical protein [Mycobacterium sp.]
MLLGVCATLFIAPISHAAMTIEEGQLLLLKGDYPAAITAAEEGLRANEGDADWTLVRAEALSEVGRYKE